MDRAVPSEPSYEPDPWRPAGHTPLRSATSLPGDTEVRSGQVRAAQAASMGSIYTYNTEVRSGQTGGSSGTTGGERLTHISYGCATRDRLGSDQHSAVSHISLAAASLHLRRIK